MPSKAPAAPDDYHRKLSQAQWRVLTSAKTGNPGAHLIVRSEHGGAVGTHASLCRLGLLDADGGITPQGHAALAARAARHASDAAPVIATVCLHVDGAGDEPMELDVDVSVTCDCGTMTTEREAIYKEADAFHVICSACGAGFDVAVKTLLVFVARPSKESAAVTSSVIPSGDRAPRRRGPDVD